MGPGRASSSAGTMVVEKRIASPQGSTVKIVRNTSPDWPPFNPKVKLTTKSGRTFMPRAGKPKVRTGCIVCKIRRVKCDEGKPQCLKCTSTGRKCDGYVGQESPPQKAQYYQPGSHYESWNALTAYRPSLDIVGDINERRSFHYFRSQTAPEISGYPDSDVWNRLVLQASHKEPIVRHALLVLSTVHEEYRIVRVGQHGDSQRSLSGFGLQQYVKAVKLLVNHLSTNQASLQVTLLTCLIFVCIEFLQNNFDEGLTHLKSGLQILHDVKQNGISTTALAHGQRVDESLAGAFFRLNIQATIHGSPTSDFNSSKSSKHVEITPSIPAYFTSMAEARNCFDVKLSSIFRLIRKMYSPEVANAMPEPLPAQGPLSIQALRESYLNDLQRWHNAFEALIPRISPPSSPNQSLTHHDPEAASILLLQLYYTFIFIVLSTVFASSEMIFDEYLGSFRYMLSLAETLIHEYPGPGLPVCSFDLGLLAPLFFFVVKCRDLKMRRSALALLRLAPEREGMWLRAPLVQTAELKIQIEESRRGDLPEHVLLPVHARTYAEKLVDIVIEGIKVPVLRFQRGPVLMDGSTPVYEEMLVDLDLRMGSFI